jgi:hypothetical protein
VASQQRVPVACVVARAVRREIEAAHKGPLGVADPEKEGFIAKPWRNAFVANAGVTYSA